MHNISAPYHFEAIGGALAVAVNEHCRLSEDGILLARFAAPTKDDTACDLGSGNGIIPLYWCRREPPIHITAVEREEAFVTLCRASVERSGVADRITVLHADWNNSDALPPAGSMSLVTCNPPYFPFGATRPSPDVLRQAARTEDTPAVLDDVCRAAKRLLTKDGRFCLCHRPERLDDVLAAVRRQALKPRRLQFVQTRDNTAPWLFLLETAASGTLKVLLPLVGQPRGTHTAVYKTLYR